MSIIAGIRPFIKPNYWPSTSHYCKRIFRYRGQQPYIYYYAWHKTCTNGQENDDDDDDNNNNINNKNNNNINDNNSSNNNNNNNEIVQIRSNREGNLKPNKIIK